MKRALILSMVAVVVVGAMVAPARAQRIMSLEETVGMAIERSTVVGISRENLQNTRQNVLRNYGAFLPNATLGLYAGHSYIGPTGSVFTDAQGRPVQPAGFDYEAYNFSLSSGMNLFDWGVSYKNLRSAQHNAGAAEQDLQYQKDIITAQVIRAYYNLLRDKHLLKVQEEGVGAAERNLQQVEAFFKIGSNTRADVLQAKVRLGNARLQMITARNNHEISRATLASRLNLPFQEEFEIDESLDIQPVDPDFESEVNFMLEHRSDLLSARSRVKASDATISAAENSRWPTVAASISYGWNDRVWPDNSNFFKSEYSWSVGASLSFNIFDRFQTKSNILNARAQHRIAEYNLQQTKLDAILETKTIHLSLREADERIRVSGETVTQAQENLRLAEERYRVGAGTILETIEAGVSLTTAQSDLIRAKCDYLTAKADLLRATGRPVQ
jgi:outer membrane protein TolC